MESTVISMGRTRITKILVNKMDILATRPQRAFIKKLIGIVNAVVAVSMAMISIRSVKLAKFIMESPVFFNMAPVMPVKRKLIKPMIITKAYLARICSVLLILRLCIKKSCFASKYWAQAIRIRIYKPLQRYG